MLQLARGDAERLLDFVGSAAALDAQEPFTTALLDRLAKTLESEFATYYTYVLGRQADHGYVACSLEARYAPLATGWREVPEYAHEPRRSSVGLWSDVLDQGSRRRFESAGFAPAFQIVDCAWTTFGIGGDERAMLNVHRQERDFTERDRVRLLALHPHIAMLIRAAAARRRLADLMDAADSTRADEQRGFVLLRAGLQVEHVSPAARLLLARWFGVDEVLPPPIEHWLHGESPRDPLRVTRGDRRLVVEAPARRALVLTEEAALPAVLTKREIEVLRGLADGKSTAELAAVLWVTPATVSKHLEHIYRKLGVRSRTAALAAVGVRLEALTPPE